MDDKSVEKNVREAVEAAGKAYDIALEEYNKDPWKHRSDEMRCRSCMWFVSKVAVGRPDLIVGRCRRHAPTMIGYPVVFPADFCGDHKLDENYGR